MPNEVTEQSEIIETDDVKQTEIDTPEGTAPDGLVENEEKQVEPAKTFTQAEVDSLIQKRLLKEEGRIHRRIEQQTQEQKQAEARQEPQRESFRDDDAYDQARRDAEAERKADEKLAQRAKAKEADDRNEKFLEKAEAASERYPDFQTVISNPSLAINEGMAEFISESDTGADVAYYLGKNPMTATRIAQMSPMKAARELVRIESELAARPKATSSKAPPPIEPVGNRGNASESALPSDSDDIATWMRKERARMTKRY